MAQLFEGEDAGMKLWMRLLFCLAVLFLALNLHAQADNKPKDAEGCADSPLITRFPGSIIHSCENKAFENADFPLGHDKDGNAITKHLEGEYHFWDLGTREETSEIQAFRNFLTALKTANFTIDYASSPRALAAHKGNTWLFIDNKGTRYYQTIVAVKEMQLEVAADASSLSDEIRKSGHVAVYGIQFDTGGAAIPAESQQVLGEIVKLLQGGSRFETTH
jgi:OmpA-OmpF porin, OOP family